jgi:glutathione synthase/RimK-type ligase-like ATP-grasp enzyme
MGSPSGARVALATCSRFPDLAEDGPAMLDALARRGLEATPQIWDEPETDWDRFDLVVVRATWDYTERRAEFLDWARRVPRLANPYGVIEWNSDKTYLRDLCSAGIPTVPTQWCEPDSAIVLPAAEIVVKPSVGAGARGAGRYGPEDREAATAHVERLGAAGFTVMVQPYLAAVESAGERGLVYLGGRYSHAVNKPALLANRGAYVEGTLTWELVSATTPTAAERAFAEDVLAATPAGRENLLYARVDLLPGDDGTPLLIELEVTEPCLYLGRGPGSPEAFADAVEGWLARR